MCVTVSHFWLKRGFYTKLTFKPSLPFYDYTTDHGIAHSTLNLFNFTVLFSGPATCSFQLKVSNSTDEFCISCTKKHCFLLWFLNAWCCGKCSTTEWLSYMRIIYYKIHTTNSNVLFSHFYMWVEKEQDLEWEGAKRGGSGK
jgi:hypothetical protein